VSGVSLVCLIALSQTPARLVSFENGAAPLSATNAIATGDFEVSQMSHMGALVVPAKFQVRAEAVSPEQNNSVPEVAKSAVKKSFKPMSKPDFIPARAVQHRLKSPMLVRTSMAGRDLVPQTLFLVMQTEVVQTRQYDASGAVVWDLCVWRVTVVGPAQNKIEAGIAAKSI